MKRMAKVGTNGINTAMVRIPKDMATKLDIKTGDYVMLQLVPEGILITLDEKYTPPPLTGK